MGDPRRSWRKLTDQERAVLGRLLSAAFYGRDELVAQVPSALVSRIDREGSLQFRVVGPLAPVSERVPVEGRYYERADARLGPAINLLVHVVEGRLHELEVYKDDGSEITTGPFEVAPEQIEVWCN